MLFSWLVSRLSPRRPTLADGRRSGWSDCRRTLKRRGRKKEPAPFQVPVPIRLPLDGALVGAPRGELVGEGAAHHIDPLPAAIVGRGDGTPGDGGEGSFDIAELVMQIFRARDPVRVSQLQL